MKTINIEEITKLYKRLEIDPTKPKQKNIRVTMNRGTLHNKLATQRLERRSFTNKRVGSITMFGQ